MHVASYKHMYTCTALIIIVGLIITNGPQDTTVCMNVMAECYCGFTGTDPNFVVPNWRIVYRNDDGSIVSNDTVDGDDISDQDSR